MRRAVFGERKERRERPPSPPRRHRRTAHGSYLGSGEGERAALGSATRRLLARSAAVVESRRACRGEKPPLLEEERRRSEGRREAIEAEEEMARFFRWLREEGLFPIRRSESIKTLEIGRLV